jgi:uncharacterized protein
LLQAATFVPANEKNKIMPQQHGDWKDLFRAASEGNVAEMVYYLDAGQIDVNFQHPEYMSSILCAAAKAGHVAAVSLLLAHGADPFVTEYWSDQYPLQFARDACHHDVVDVLLDAMTTKLKMTKRNENNNDDTAMSAATAATVAEILLSNIVQTIWVDTKDESLVAAVARRGHCVIWPTATATQLSYVRATTLNRKIFGVSQLLRDDNNNNNDNDNPIMAKTTTMADEPLRTIHVAFVDNRYEDDDDDDDNEHYNGRGSKVSDRLLRMLSPPTLPPNEKVQSVAAGTGLPSPLQPVPLPSSRWKFPTMPPERLILARQPTTEPMTSAGDLVPYDVVLLPTTTRPLSSWWWWSSSLWSLLSSYVPYFDRGPSFVDAAVTAIFPVVPPRRCTTSDGNYHIEF